MGAIAAQAGRAQLKHTMLFEVSGDLVAVVNDEREPSDAEWEPYMARCREVLARHGRQRILVRSAGGGPNSAQRQSIKALFNGRPQRVAVLAPPFVRGIITALSWFNPQVRAFGSTDLAAAVQHLELDAEQARWASEALERMRQELDALRASERESEAR